MVDWHRFIPADFEYDFEKDKLAAHGVAFEEAVECFFSNFQIQFKYWDTLRKVLQVILSHNP